MHFTIKVFVFVSFFFFDGSGLAILYRRSRSQLKSFCKWLKRFPVTAGQKYATAITVGISYLVLQLALTLLEQRLQNFTARSRVVLIEIYKN